MKSGGALVLGAVVLASAAIFGSRPVAVAGFGLLLAGLLARTWAGRLRTPLSARLTVEPAPATEGDEVRLRVSVARPPRLLVGSARMYGSVDRLGGLECRLRRRGGSLVGSAVLGRPPRGRYDVTEGALELGEPLGLETRRQPLSDLPPIVVRPRTIRLDSLFTEGGLAGGAGRRLLLRRPIGFDFHSVREYEQGESLRRVHWPTTARRGQLMVKELEDAPREAAVVVLDCDPAGVAGIPQASSFDAAARAAGSILRLYASRRRPARLVSTGRNRALVSVSSPADLDAALDALAAVEPDADHSLRRELGDPRSPVARAAELVVVTSVLDESNVGALVDRATRSPASVVWLDAASFAGRPTRTSPSLLRLAAAGVPVAVVRRGDDLVAALAAPRQERHAVG